MGTVEEEDDGAAMEGRLRRMWEEREAHTRAAPSPRIS